MAIHPSHCAKIQTNKDMQKSRQQIELSLIDLNTGQLEWLPSNPRQWTKEDLDNTTESIKRDPDFLEDRPLLLTPNGERFVVFGGNLRSRACIEAKVQSAPASVYIPETEEDFETIKRRAMLDNGSFGSWDYDALANEWDSLPLTDWGVPAWEQPKNDTENKGPKDISDQIVNEFKVEVTCVNEAEQERLYNKLIDQGYECRILTL